MPWTDDPRHRTLGMYSAVCNDSKFHEGCQQPVSACQDWPCGDGCCESSADRAGGRQTWCKKNVRDERSAVVMRKARSAMGAAPPTASEADFSHAWRHDEVVETSRSTLKSQISSMLPRLTHLQTLNAFRAWRGAWSSLAELGGLAKAARAPTFRLGLVWRSR